MEPSNWPPEGSAWPPEGPARDAVEGYLSGVDAPAVTERKRDPAGRISEAACRLLRWSPSRVVLFHPLSEDWQVGPLVVGPPAITLAFYWRDTGYNLYTWFDPQGTFDGAYYNIVRPDGYRYQDQLLQYEDWVLDLLITPDGDEHLLDLDEIDELPGPERRIALHEARALQPQSKSIAAASIAAVRNMLGGHSRLRG